MPAGAVYVGRPSKWGNPYHVVKVWPGPEYEVHFRDRDWADDIYRDRLDAVRNSVDRYRRRLSMMSVNGVELAGLDLVCWCPLDAPCHADVLLEIANQ